MRPLLPAYIWLEKETPSGNTYLTLGMQGKKGSLLVDEHSESRAKKSPSIHMPSTTAPEDHSSWRGRYDILVGCSDAKASI